MVTIVNDQIENLINDLKTNPDSRRLMVSSWNVGELDQMVLPPCHYGFQVYTRELSLEDRMILCKEKWDYSWNRTINLEDIEWRMNNEWNTPTKKYRLEYKNEIVEYYE